jgi:coenzyme Q-binding protein COQ10
MAGGGVEAGRDAVRGDWTMGFASRTPDQLFTLAADIESYPRFVPWCIATRILARADDHWRCDNLFGVGPIRLRFHTRAEFEPPHVIRITSSDGPFRSFQLYWRFAPDDGGTRVDAGFEARFNSDVLRLAARVSLAEVERRVIAAFRRRVEQLYGS